MKVRPSSWIVIGGPKNVDRTLGRKKEMGQSWFVGLTRKIL